MEKLRQRIYNEQTNEIIRDEAFEPKKKTKHYHYYLTFYSALAKANKSLSSTMLLILGQMDSKNKIVLDKEKLKILNSNYGVSVNALKMATSRMCKDGLMLRSASTIYFVNPYYFTKTSLYRIEDLRKEYSEILFNTKQKTKPTEIKRISVLEKQISDILRK